MTDDFYDELADICYECTGYGDDYYADDDGVLVCACGKCWVQERKDEVSENEN